MLWVDKYRPKSLDKVIVHEDIAQKLKKLVRLFVQTLGYFLEGFSMNWKLIFDSPLRFPSKIVHICSFMGRQVLVRKP